MFFEKYRSTFHRFWCFVFFSIFCSLRFSDPISFLNPCSSLEVGKHTTPSCFAVSAGDRYFPILLSNASTSHGKRPATLILLHFWTDLYSYKTRHRAPAPPPFSPYHHYIGPIIANWGPPLSSTLKPSPEKRNVWSSKNASKVFCIPSQNMPFPLNMEPTPRA